MNLSKGKVYQSSNLNIGSIALMNSPSKNSIIKINNKEINLSKFKFFTFNLKKIKIESNSKIIRGEYLGEMHGVIRPLLKWETNKE